LSGDQRKRLYQPAAIAQRVRPAMSFTPLFLRSAVRRERGGKESTRWDRGGGGGYIRD
jgi:hypothetical protein